MIKNKNLIKIIINTIIILLSFFSVSFADTIYLKFGKEVEGKIIEKTDKYIKIDFEGVTLTYWLDEIERIEEAITPSTNVEKQKGALVVVGDATLTYASYFFELPLGWMDDIPNLTLTHQRGFWRGKHRDSETWIQIVPTKKDKGESLSDFVRIAKEEGISKGGCSPNFMQRNYIFKASFNYPYEVYSTNNCPTGTYGLIVLADLPEHVISFNLYGKGESENCLNPHLVDFNKVIASFRWILGLSDEEIGSMFKKF